MYKSCLALGLAAGLGLAAPPSPADSDRVAKLIEQLGSASFDDREKASAALETLGEPALDALRKAARGEDAEVKRRAAELVLRIEKTIESTPILTPKKVHLVFKNTPVTEALAQFRKMTGYDLVLEDPQDKLQERRVTLDTGEVPFWRALDLFCQKAGLLEASACPMTPAAVPEAAPVLSPLPVPIGPRGKPVGRAAALSFEADGSPPPPTKPALPPPIPGTAKPAKGGVPISTRQYHPGRITLVDGKAEPRPTDDTTAIRIRAVSNPGVASRSIAGEVCIWLEATPEPRLGWEGVAGVRLEKAIDDRGQRLMEAPETEPSSVSSWGMNQHASVRLKKAEKESKSLKELAGVLTVRVQGEPRPLITVDDVQQSAGRTARGKDEGSIKVLEVKAGKEETTLRVEMQPPPGASPVSSASAQSGAVSSFRGLTLVDARGNALPAQYQVHGKAVPGGLPVMEYQIVYRPEKDQGPPAKLLWIGRRSVTVEVPFVLKDVPLP
jgi:hypothetical protein